METAATLWEGMPYTAPAGWCVTSRTDAKDASPSCAPRVVLDHLDVLVDVYNTHHHCCWPRTLLDTCLADAGQVPDHAAPDDVRERRRRVASYMRTLHRAQRGGPPRALLARRIVYHNRLPPVLRCAHDGEVVYVLTGALRLTRALPPSHAWSAHTARVHFPTFLAMRPCADCAAHLQPDPPALAKPGAATVRPLLMLLQDVQPCTTPASEAVEWCAEYTSFTWLLTPLGNAHLPFRVNVKRTPQWRRRDTQPARSAPAALDELDALRLAFTIWASPAKVQAELDERLRRFARYTPVVSREVRYGVAGHTLPAADVLGTLGRRRQRTLRQRPGRLRHHLQRRVSSTPRAVVSGSDEDAETASVDFDAALEDTTTAQQRGDDDAFDFVHIADLCATAPLRREHCEAPGSTLLGALLPRWTRWPLRVRVWVDKDDVRVVDATASLSDLADVVEPP